MPKENGPSKTGSRWIRVDGAVRLIDTPNSRMGLEVDLGLLPWDPFDALGKKVTLLLPQDQSQNGSGDEETDGLQQALRYVGHAADRCKEFAEAGNGDSSDWWNAYRTWNWLRKHLSGEWGEETAASEASSPTGDEEEELPSLPGAASILEYTLGALRTIPLSHWEETVATLDPEAPSREEAIRTVQILSRLLRKPSRADHGEAPIPGEGEPPEASLEARRDAAGDASSPSSRELPPEPHPEPRPSASTLDDPVSPDGDDMSFDYAHGFDEGYRMGRKVGFAMGSHARKRGPQAPDRP